MIEQNPIEHLIGKQIKLFIELPGGYVFETDAELKNIFTEIGVLFVRLGFRIKPKANDLHHLRYYIMKRQREIIEQWKSI